MRRSLPSTATQGAHNRTSEHVRVCWGMWLPRTEAVLLEELADPHPDLRKGRDVVPEDLVV
eukprot:5545692-Prymnesium_polylepis.1